MRKLGSCVTWLTIFLLGTACSDSDEHSIRKASTDYCEAWVGIIRLAEPDEESHSLGEETREVPLLLPPDDATQQWGFALACDYDDRPCTVRYRLYTPTENWSRNTNEVPAIDRTIRTPPGGVVRPFRFDPGDYYGTYRLVIDLESHTVCDTNVTAVR